MAWFEWGVNTSYGNITAPQAIGSGQGVIRVSVPLTNLAEGGVYHYRLVASNSVGMVRGFDSMFTTGARVQYWGSFYGLGTPVMPSGLTNLVGVASGHRHSLGIRDDGTVVVWMAGSLVQNYWNYGQTNVPVGLSNVVAVAGGFSHCLALKEDGTVVGWGKYADGTPATVPDYVTNQILNKITGVTNAIAIAAGDFHSVALKGDGTVVAWSKDPYYQNNVPFNLSNVVAITCDSSTTTALKADGTLGWSVGGIGNLQSAQGVVQVANMAGYTLALRTNGTVLEGGILLAPDVPKPANLSNVVAVAVGVWCGQALKSDGSLVGWGYSGDVARIPAGLTNLVAFAGGDYSMVGIAPTNLPPYQFCSTSYSAAINLPKVISLCVYDPNGDPLTFRITSLPTKGTLYQYSTNGLGDVISAPGTVVSDPSRVIFMPATNQFGSPYDAFTFVANDGELDSPPITYTISIPAPQPPFIQSTIFTNVPLPAVALSFVGASNASYSVWRSEDLSSWYYLGAATQGSLGQFSFTDNTISNLPCGFYRIQSP